MAKNALPFLLAGGGALIVLAKSKKKKKKKPAATTTPSETPDTPEEEPKKPSGPGVPPSEPEPGMGNPAAIYCVENGGEYVVRQDNKGNESGVCVMPDGSEVPGWSWTRGELVPGPAVDGLEAQGKVVMSKIGQAVTISLMEDPPTPGKLITFWQVAADSDLKPQKVLIDKQVKMPATSPYRRHFTFWTTTPGVGRAVFERISPRGDVQQGVTVMIESQEE